MSKQTAFGYTQDKLPPLHCWEKLAGTVTDKLLILSQFSKTCQMGPHNKKKKVSVSLRKQTVTVGCAEKWAHCLYITVSKAFCHKASNEISPLRKNAQNSNTVQRVFLFEIVDFQKLCIHNILCRESLRIVSWCSHQLFLSGARQNLTSV